MIALFLVGFWYWIIYSFVRQYRKNQDRDWDLEYVRLKIENPAVYAELEAQKAAAAVAQIAQARRNRRAALLTLLGGITLLALGEIVLALSSH